MADQGRDRRVARVIDREVAPVWHDRFARLIFQRLAAKPKSIVLDVHCGPGRTTGELLQRLDDSSRVFALEPDPAFIARAKARVRAEWKDRVYFKQGDLSAVTAMGDDTYDITIANLVLDEAHDRAGVLAELMRVTKPGGHVLASWAMQGTWTEVEDLFAEVLRDSGLGDGALRRLERLRSLRPTGAALAELAEELGVDAERLVIEQKRHELLFPSGREFLFAPVVEHGPLRLWKAIIGRDGKPQELFWRLKEAIDAYYAQHVFSVTMIAGLLQIEVPGDGAPSLAGFWDRYPELDRLWSDEPAASAEASDSDLDMDIDIDLDDDEATPAAASGVSPRAPSPKPTPADEFGKDDEDIFAALEEDDAEIDSLLDDVFEFGEGDTIAKRKRTLSTPSLEAARERHGGAAPKKQPPKPPPGKLKPGQSGSGVRPKLEPGESGSGPIAVKPQRKTKRDSLRLKPLPSPSGKHKAVKKK